MFLNGSLTRYVYESTRFLSLKMRKVLKHIPNVYAGFSVFPFQCFAMFCVRRQRLWGRYSTGLRECFCSSEAEELR